jgi:hypothetical protein
MTMFRGIPLLCALLLAPTLAQATVIAYWSFDDGVPDSSAGLLPTSVNSPALDGSGQGNGTGGAAPIFRTQIPGLNITDGLGGPVVNASNSTALEFNNPDMPGNPNSGNGSRVSVTDPGGPGSLLKLASFTVEGFVRLDSFVNFSTLFTKNRADSGGSTWMLDTDNTNRLRARFDTQDLGTASGTGFNQAFSTSGVLPDGQWHHVAMTYNSATSAVDLYMDYLRVGGGTITGNRPLVYDNSPFRIGSTGGGRGTDGWIDEVRLSDVVLAPGQFLRAVPEPSTALLLALGLTFLRRARPA